MKDVIVKLLGFYVEYRIKLNSLKRTYWTWIDREWFHNPMSHEDLMRLMRGDNK